MTPEQLKASILQYAIQGKLVEQRPEEGTAEELYQQIQAKKKQLMKEGKIKKEKPLPEITEEEIPFDIPESWKWVRMGEIGNTNIGLTYSPTDKSDEGTIVLRSSNIQKGYIDYTDIVKVNCNIPKKAMISKGDLLICARNGSRSLVGKAAIVEQDGMAFGAFMAKFCSQINDYILKFLQSPIFRSQLEGVKTETINQITQGVLRNQIMPLPPRKEQLRIIKKIEEMLPLVERYAASYEELEKLNAKFPEDMKKSILQYAIQGKLVEQRPEEGTAEELYRQIQAEKQQLMKEGKIKKEKPLPAITESEIPFDIPESWKWVRLRDICTKIVDGDHNPPAGIREPSEYLMLSATNINHDTVVDLSKVRYLTKEVYDIENQRTNVNINDIFFTIVGASMGRSCVYKGGYNICFQRSVSVISTKIFPEYLKRVLDTPYIQTFMYANASGTAQKGFYLKQVENLVIPLPPLAEQKRIVQKINQLLPYCQQLIK